MGAEIKKLDDYRDVHDLKKATLNFGHYLDSLDEESCKRLRLIFFVS
jgi:hypothetical protein